MAGQNRAFAGCWPQRFAVALSGCVSVPDAIKGTSPTPQQDLVRVMNARSCTLARKRALAVRWSSTNQRGKPAEIATVPLDSGARPSAGRAVPRKDFADVNGFLDPVDFRGQLVTVVGPIRRGELTAKVGNAVEVYANERHGYKSWNVVQQVVMPPQPIDPWMLGPPWGYGYGGWG